MTSEQSQALIDFFWDYYCLQEPNIYVYQLAKQFPEEAKKGKLKALKSKAHKYKKPKNH